MKAMLLWLMGFGVFAYGAILQLNENTTYLKANPWMEYYADKNQTLSFETIEDVPWQPMQGSNLGGMNHHASWTRLGLQNTASKPAIYILKNPRAGMDAIDVHLKRDNGQSETILLGDQRNIEQRALPHRYSVFSLTLAPNESIEIITKLSNSIGASEAQWEIYGENYFPIFSIRESLWWGLCAGFSLALLLYSFPILIKQKDVALASFFALYVLSSLLYQNALNGTLYILGLSGPTLNIALIFLGILFGLFTAMLMLRFLIIIHFKHGLVYYSIWGMVIVFGIDLIYLVLALNHIVAMTHMAQFANAFAIVRILVWFGLLFQVLKLGHNKIFIYLFLGHTALLVAYLFLSLQSAGLLENSFITIYGLSIGTMIETYCFAMSITSFIDSLEDEKRRQDKIIKIQLRFSSIGRIIANIAHQWKVPLVRSGALLARTEGLIYFEEKNILPTLKEEIIPQLRESFDFMQKTIDDFYALYNDSADKSIFYPSKAVKSVWEMLSAKATVRNISLDLRCDEALLIKTYEHHFAHIVMILLDNAIETAYERNISNTSITVTIDFEQSQHTNLRLIVEDTLGGIWQKPLESIFEFESSRKNDKNTPHGTGLFMLKTILETFFKGIISATNTAKGARFEINIIE